MGGQGQGVEGVPSLALLVPIAGAQSGDFGDAAGETGGGHLEASRPTSGGGLKTLGISTVFIRDVGSLIGPDDSALILLLQTSASGGLLRKLHDYGGTLLHTTLSPVQEAELKAALTPGDATPGRREDDETSKRVGGGDQEEARRR